MSSGRESDREILLRHARHPSKTGALSPREFSKIGSCKNPLCGDSAQVGVNEVDGQIEKIQMQLSGCGISIASASMMAETVEGKSVREALNMLADFNDTLTQPGTNWPESLESLKALSHLKENPARVPCALIGWFALKDALLAREKPSDAPAH